jgi:hypothetical protein
VQLYSAEEKRTSFLGFFFFFAVLGFELRTYTSSHYTSLFVMGFFEVGSHELLVQAGFEL